MPLADLPRHGLLTEGKLRNDVSIPPPLYVCVTKPCSRARIWNETTKDFCREFVSRRQDCDDEDSSPLKRPLEGQKGESVAKVVCLDSGNK